jgi:hypothetical protein
MPGPHFPMVKKKARIRPVVLMARKPRQQRSAPIEARRVSSTSPGSAVSGSSSRENEPMLQMCRELGFAIASEPRDPAVMLVRNKLPEN